MNTRRTPQTAAALVLAMMITLSIFSGVAHLAAPAPTAAMLAQTVPAAANS